MTISASASDAAPKRAISDRVLSDFTSNTADLGWYVVNDNVMGGRSTGGFKPAGETLHFQGRTNTNGGGFSSIRTSPLRLDLSSYDGIRVRVKADGRRYTWRLSTSARYRGRPVSYWADFETRKNEWVEARIPFSRFKPQFRGMKLPGPKLDPSDIEGMGLMIYDKRDGVFDLRMDSVQAYTTPPAFSLRSFRQKRRLLVLSAPSGQDEDVQLQLVRLAAARKGFVERDMTLVLLLDRGDAKAGERSLNQAEVAAARKALDIQPATFELRLVGKDGGVKRSAKAPVTMKSLYALIDSMTGSRASRVAPRLETVM